MGECPLSSSRPAGDESIEIVVRHLYASAVDIDSGQARWLAYRVLPDSVGVASLLPRRWLIDQLMTASSQLDAEFSAGIQVIEPEYHNPEESSYLTSEIFFDSDDRGRLAPMTSFAGTPYWGELNYLSNMAPLPGALVLGAWSRVDMAINEYAQRGAQLYVISGPIMAQEPAAGAAQPEGYFKLVSDGNISSAFLFDSNTRQHARYCDQLVALDELQNKTGLDFFPGLNLPVSNQLNEELACY
jgi:endonuclease G